MHLFSSLTKAPGLLTPSVAGLAGPLSLVIVGGFNLHSPPTHTHTIRRPNDRAGNLPFKIRDWLPVRYTKALQSLAEDKAPPPPSRTLPKAPDVAVDRQHEPSGDIAVPHPLCS